MECIRSTSSAGEVKVPVQLNLPSRDVLSGLKINVEVITVSVDKVETVISFLLVTSTPPMVQLAVGELIKPFTVLDTVQVRL